MGVKISQPFSYDLCVIIRYIYNPTQSQLGIKRLHQHIDKELSKRIIDLYDNVGPSKLPKGAHKLLDTADYVIPKLPKEIHRGINMEFYKFMSKKIRALK